MAAGGVLTEKASVRSAVQSSFKDIPVVPLSVALQSLQQLTPGANILHANPLVASGSTGGPDFYGSRLLIRRT